MEGSPVILHASNATLKSQSRVEVCCCHCAINMNMMSVF